jgi:DnaK suppressor protein
MNKNPNEGLKRSLAERKREILREIQDKFRDVRAEAEWKETSEKLGTGEIFEADTQQDIEFALIQMKAETLDQINQALSLLDEGAYGYCLECGEEIPERRLRALPFAIRCKDCEEALEVAEERVRDRLLMVGSHVER